MLKTISLMVLGATLGLALVAGDAHAAKRLGGGKSTGMQREAVTQPHTPAAPSSSPSVAAAPKPAQAAAAPAAAAAAPKRSWLGPIAGIAAGLGLAALASHLGFGQELATFMMLALIGVAVLAVVGWVMRKRLASAQPQPAWAGAGVGAGAGVEPTRYTANDRSLHGAAAGTGAGGSLIGSNLAGGSTADRVWPQGFDAAAFEANARQQFLALQAAHDAGNLAEIRRCTTDEMFDALRQEVADRGPQATTEVRDLQATVVDVQEDTHGHVVTVRFTGTVVEDRGVAEPLDEFWHLSKSRFGHSGWLLAGIQQGA
jgi:predicted lipid-binding transport protein (Tim44 family)